MVFNVIATAYRSDLSSICSLSQGKVTFFFLIYVHVVSQYHSICFSQVVGPKLMENRKPYKLKNVLIIYNFLQVIFSTWLFYEASSTGWLKDYSYRCQPVDYSRSERAMRIASGCYWYYISKFTEFLDTFFFVMRKRYDQVSTLHVIHHGIMPFSGKFMILIITCRYETSLKFNFFFFNYSLVGCKIHSRRSQLILWIY